MAIQAAVLEAEVRVKKSGAVRDLDTLQREFADTGRAAQKAGAETEQAGRRAEKGGKGFKAGSVLVKAAAGSMAAALATKVITNASDLNEVLSKTGVVFGPQADRVTKKANEMAEAFGIGKTEFLDAASSIGLIGKASGLTQAAAAKLSNKIGALAADASSFYNVKMSDALADIKSGLVGEAEPMRKYGVLLNEAAVAQEAMRLGLSKTGKDLTEGQKVQARSSLILKGMKDASGDLARTQGSVANRTRELQGRIKNMSAEMGQKALPVVADFLGFLNKEGIPAVQDFADSFEKDVLPTLKAFAGLVGDVAGALNDLPGPLKSNGLALAALTLLYWKATPAIQSAVTKGNAWATSLGTQAGRAKAATSATQGMVRGVQTLAGAGGMLLLAKSMGEVDQSTKTMQQTLGGAAIGLSMGGPVGGAIGALAGFTASLATETDTASESWKKARTEAFQFGETIDGVTGKVKKNTDALILNALEKSNPDAVKAAARLGISERTLAGYVRGNAKERRNYNRLIREGILANTQYEYANGGAARAVDVLRQSLADQGHEIGPVTEGIVNSYRRQAAEAKAAAKRGRELSAALKGVPTKVASQIVTQGADVSLKELETLIDKYKRTPKQVRTLVKNLGVPVAKRELQTLIDHGKTLDKLDPSVTVSANTKPANDALAGLTGYLQSIIRTPWNIPVGVKKKGKADGGTILAMPSLFSQGGSVAGARYPYGDKVPTMLAPGEEVISNRHGQADRFRGLLKAINSNRLASGGTVGLAKGGTVSPGIVGNIPAALAAGLGPATKVLNQIAKLIRQQTSGKKEARLIAYLRERQGKVEALEARRARVAAALNAQIAKRDELVQQRDQFRADVKQGISAQANVLNSGNNVGDIATNLATQVGKANEFAAAIAKMRSMGYSNAVVQQVAAAGIEGGLEVAKALTSGSAAQVSSINSSFAQINAVADKQSAMLSSQMFDAGIQAANGVIKGLTQQQAAIERTLVSIAKGMVRALRRALGINSPARKLIPEGINTARGLEVGLKRRRKHVMLEGRRLALAAMHGVQGIDTPGGTPWAFQGAPRGLTPTAMAGASLGGPSVHMEFKTYNSVAEPQSRTTNKALDRVAALGLV